MEIAQQAVEGVAHGVSVLPQEDGAQAAVGNLRDMIASGRVEVRAYPRGPLHAKAYLCWYAGHAEHGSRRWWGRRTSRWRDSPAIPS